MITATFVLERETKGAVRYQEIDANCQPLDFNDAAIATLYIRKRALDGNIPTKITVTINVEA